MLKSCVEPVLVHTRAYVLKEFLPTSSFIYFCVILYFVEFSYSSYLVPMSMPADLLFHLSVTFMVEGYFLCPFNL
jgi:hypothetical protein